MDLIQKGRELFWSPDVWLPPNVTWADISPGSKPDVNHADYRDLLWPLPLAMVIMLIRYSLERYVSARSTFVSFLMNMQKSFDLECEGHTELCVETPKNP